MAARRVGRGPSSTTSPASVTVTARRGDASRFAADLLVVPWIEDGSRERGALRSLDLAAGGEIGRALKLRGLTGRARETALVLPKSGVRAPRVLVLGLGKKKALTAESFRRSLGSAAKESLRAKGVASAAIAVSDDLLDAIPSETAGEAAAEALKLALYRFRRYLRVGAEDAPSTLRVTLIGATPAAAAALRRGAERGSTFADATNFARDLVNEAPSVMTPARLASEARSLGKRGSGVSVSVLEAAALRRLGMGGILAVGAGGRVPPRMIVLRCGPRGGRPIVLVGKGVTFDSGGLQIKPAKSMENMKCDMSGAAAVLGVFHALRALRPRVGVIGLVPTAENLVGEAAFKPRDVIRMHSGKTVEILHTDAEGRLLLGDALSYAQRERARATVDVATLTGACVVALGDWIAGLFSTDADLRDSLARAAAEAGEDVWPLPIHEDYRDRLKGDVSDLKNVAGGGNGGAVIAALFLRAFAGDGPWAHLDIAGPAFLEGSREYSPKGGTGFGVRTLLRWIAAESAKPR
jgi:leucyl aminopeptidase